MERYLTDEYISNGELSASLKIVKGVCPPHPHDFFEIEYILDGEGTYNVDGVDYPIKNGMLFLMTPISFHSLKTEGTKLYNLMFSERICDPDALSILAVRGSIAIEIKKTDAVFFENIFAELCKNRDNHKYYFYLLNTVLYKIAGCIDTAVPDTEALPISRGMFYLISHFRENPTLAETAAYAGFTPTYFSSVFKKETGLNFKEYLDNLRFEYAKKLAESTDMTVMEIATDSGFYDYPNFIRRFKSRFGTSVTELRRSPKKT